MENNDKQQIGGYFSTKNASKDEALKGIVAARISASEDVTDKEYTALSNLIRVATSDGCRISLVQETKSRSSRSSRISPTGMLLPAGTVEYFSVTPGSKVSVTGTANISSIE